MSIVVSTTWPNVTPEAYDAVTEIIRFDEDPPEGAVSHIAWFTEGGLNVVDVWQSQADFEQFARERLTPATLEVPGFHGEPNVKFFPLHAHALASAPVTADV